MLKWLTKMANNKKLFAGAAPTSAGSAEYTVPTGYMTLVRDINVCNTTAASLNCALHLVPVGGSATTSNMLIPNSPIDAYSMLQWTGEQVLSAGDFIQVIGSGSGLTVNISGEEVRLFR